MTAIPANVQSVLKKACYDCHSNNTIYPWYMNLQPVAWFMTSHVIDGKRHLNFSEFGAYPKIKQTKKLQGIAKEVKKGDMPISSYTLMHAEARLSKEEKNLIINWADSLVRKD